MSSANSKLKRTAAASRGFLATTRFSCNFSWIWVGHKMQQWDHRSVHRKLFGMWSYTHELFWNCRNFIRSCWLIQPNASKVSITVILVTKAKADTQQRRLKQRLVEAWSAMPQRVIDEAIDKWRRRLRCCVSAEGGHFEHKLWHLRRHCEFNGFVQPVRFYH